MAAELIEAGVDVNDTYRRLYERVPIEKLHLIARALEKVAALRRRPARGHLHRRRGLRRDRRRGGPHRGDHRLRPRPRGHRGRRRRPRQDRRRALGAQGQPALHRRRRRRLGDRPRARAAAGTGARPGSAATCRTPSWSSSCVPRSQPRSAEPAGGAGPARRQAGGHHLPRRRRPRAARLRRQDRPRRHPRPVRDRPADRAPRPPGDPRAAPVHGPAEDLPRDGAVRRRLDHRRPATARSPRPGVMPAGELELPTGRAPPAPARATRRSRSAASAPTGGRAGARASSSPSGWSPCTASSSSSRAGDEAEFEIECSSGTYVRSLIADLGDAYCTELRRTRDRPVLGRRGRRGHRRSRCPKRSPVFSVFSLCRR